MTELNIHQRINKVREEIAYCGCSRLTQTRLMELLKYNPKTGSWIWVKPSSVYSSVKVGYEAGFINLRGYRVIRIDGKLYRAARLAFLFMDGYFPEHFAEHKNRITHDDRWENLRHAIKQCDVRNASRRKDNKSGVCGVSWHKRIGKWQSQITIMKKNYFLGYCNQLDEAVLTRFAAEQCIGWLACDMESSAYKYAIDKNLIKA